MQLFRLLGSIAIEGADEAKHEIASVNDEAEESSNVLGNALTKIGNIALTIGKTVAVGVATCATAIIATTKQAVGAYGEYEQLVGGVETLYKDSANLVLEYAQNAYKTAGISANQYMQQVTSFTASLLQGLNGDTAETAKVADMAIKDMADNANKMGTSMEMIQNAYQGFSKQNYTMLDNLKLGYGGTKEEMARLLADAEKLTGIKYDMSNLADVYNAIHAIQGELGITGTTAKEASDTIQGSMSAVSASWQNVLVGLADGNQDLNSLIQIFIDNLVAMLSNMIPTIQTIFSKIPSLFIGLAPLIGELIKSLAPSLLASVGQLISELVKSIPTLWGEFSTLFANFGNVIQENIPIVTEKAMSLMSSLGAKIKENIPSVLSSALDIITGFSQTLLENAPQLIYGGMELLVQLAQGIANAMPTLIQKVPQIVINIANTISQSMQTILLKGAEIVWELIKGIIGAIPTLIQEFPKVIEAIFAVWNAINWLNLGKNLMNGISEGIKNMAISLKNTASNVFKSLDDLCGTLFNGIKNTIMHPINTAKSLFTSGVSAMKDFAINTFTALKGNVTTVFNNIKNAITSPIETAKNIIKGIVDAIKGFFNFKISFPKIPMPHFSISPSGWSVGDLLKGKIPRLGIEWYDKAMDNPMLLDSPTIFGFQNGNFLGGGESGAEVVSGADTLMKMIRDASSTNNIELLEMMKNIYALLMIMSRNMGHQIVLDSGVLVGELLGDIDNGLGDEAILKARGVK